MVMVFAASIRASVPTTRFVSPGAVRRSAERLARFKVPKAVTIVTALPRNPSGKVLKRELRHQA